MQPSRGPPTGKLAGRSTSSTKSRLRGREVLSSRELYEPESCFASELRCAPKRMVHAFCVSGSATSIKQGDC